MDSLTRFYSWKELAQVSRLSSTCKGSCFFDIQHMSRPTLGQRKAKQGHISSLLFFSSLLWSLLVPLKIHPQRASPYFDLFPAATVLPAGCCCCYWLSLCRVCVCFALHCPEAVSLSHPFIQLSH